MPVSPYSRYYGLPVYDAVAPDGTSHPTTPIRPPAAPPAGPEYNHRLTGDESLESLAWNYLGDSASWWRIADANPLAFPLDLLPGAGVAIPATEDAGRVVRDGGF